MPPTYFPLRWESTGDQWWYASPIDWAAANGHYDLVRELLRIDSNHLIKLTSLRRIRRLETVWDDEEQYHDVAKCRSRVARKLFFHCESKKAKNSLIRAGYGGWLIYTAASAGDLSFVQELLERNPLLVFGEGEYGVTDILYAAARSKNSDVFRLLLDLASSPRFTTGKGGELEERIGDIPSVYKWEMINRAVHAAARGGNLKILKELLANCSDVLAYRDIQGSTIFHTAAGRGQVEILKYLLESFDIINSRDHHGNTALHVAAYRGQLAAVEALVSASPSSIYQKNNAGETFLHRAVSGFQTLAFRRLDRQIELLRQLVSAKVFNIQDVINAKNSEDRTVLHMAIIGNVHSDLVQLLMTAKSINVNVTDVDGMTPLDYLRQRPRSASSDILIRQLMSAGGIFGSQDYNARKVIVSRLKMQGNGNSSPGSSFRISDTEIFLYTGIENVSDGSGGHGSPAISSASVELSPYDSATENRSSFTRPSSVNNATQLLKQVLHWPKIKDKRPQKSKKPVDDEGSMESNKIVNTSDNAPAPLRKRFSKPSSPTNNKRTLAVRSNQSSPSAKKKLASGIRHGVMQAIPQITAQRRSRSSSFSKSSISSPSSLDKQKGICFENEGAGPSFSSQEVDSANPNLRKQGNAHNKRLKSQYFCFGTAGVSVKSPVSRHSYKHRVPSVA
ncbi:Transmembrane protein [Trema orientale]|uniref:Transmembrane protein n=1 Tax=Trema orientale TaxID=63057 RepID=A0A2P5FBX7_TREOI|nr:Transmembrane protein [Trema orientale]